MMIKYFVKLKNTTLCVPTCNFQVTCTTCMTIIIGTLGHRGVGTFSVGSGPNGQEVDQIRREIQIYIDFEGTLGVFFYGLSPSNFFGKPTPMLGQTEEYDTVFGYNLYGNTMLNGNTMSYSSV
jgi:hypothetical protein